MTSSEDLPSISVSAVSERDVDLLLLEEFVASRSFMGWFMGRCHDTDAAATCEILSAGRSITESLGESDLELFFEHNGDVTCLLIENKIRAGFQPRQAERYQERGQSYMEQQRCDGFVTVLVAPAAYLGSDSTTTKGFDVTVTYEEIRDWFADQTDGLGPRAGYKTAILDGAISKGTLGYQPEEDAPVTSFWNAYWRLAQEMARELEMNEPGPRPAGAGFVYFCPGVLPPDVSIVHKLTYGRVDIQFAGMGRQLPALHDKLGSSLEDGMTIRRAAKSGVVRLDVPRLNPSREFGPQVEKVKAGLSRALHLLHWYRDLT